MVVYSLLVGDLTNRPDDDDDGNEDGILLYGSADIESPLHCTLLATWRRLARLPFWLQRPLGTCWARSNFRESSSTKFVSTCLPCGDRNVREHLCITYRQLQGVSRVSVVKTKWQEKALFCV